jgi:hypothetical protein
MKGPNGPFLVNLGRFETTEVFEFYLCEVLL